jgi:hypothetical protein
MSVRPSVRPPVWPHRTTRLPLGGFSWNSIFEDFSKIWRVFCLSEEILNYNKTEGLLLLLLLLLLVCYLHFLRFGPDIIWSLQVLLRKSLIIWRVEQGCTNFQKSWAPGGWQETGFLLRLHRTGFSCPGELTPGLSAPPSMDDHNDWYFLFHIFV